MAKISRFLLSMISFISKFYHKKPLKTAIDTQPPIILMDEVLSPKTVFRLPYIKTENGGASRIFISDSNDSPTSWKLLNSDIEVRVGDSVKVSKYRGVVYVGIFNVTPPKIIMYEDLL